MMAQAGAILMSLGRKPDTETENRKKEVKLWYLKKIIEKRDFGLDFTCKQSRETILGNNPSHYAEGGRGNFS